MGQRAKATPETVKKAIQQLENEGREPTPSRVQAITKGSKTTVYKVLREMQDEDVKKQLRKPLPQLEDIITDSDQ